MNASETQVLLTALFSSIFGSGFMSFVIFMIQRRDKKKESRSAEAEMLIGLGHDKIVYLTDCYVKRGAITLKEKRNLEFLAQPYFKSGGNGDGKIGYDACQKLDVVSEDVAEEMDLMIKRKEYGIDDDE